jgi:predicted O-linked N-acetylglucosamine transferase (SPINDLY family)
MDYRITDRYTDPEGMTEALHTEKLARMPESQWCWVPPYEVPERKPAGTPRPVTFGSFNSLAKIQDPCLDKWCEVLRRVPDSLLRVYGMGHPVYSHRLLARLAERGVEKRRVTLVGWLQIHEYFDAFGDVDIALDTMPYNGGTTTFATYWMGVPMVALAGTRGIARGGYSIARSAGYGELCVTSGEQWVERNVELAKDEAGRLALGRSLRPRLQASALMDAARFTRDLESLYRGMLKGSRG